MSKVPCVMPNARASVLETFNAPLALREFSLPARLEPGAALVRTEMAGICGTDVHLWKGQLPISLPVILGHETVGRLEQIGEGLERDWTGQPVKTGDRVTWTSSTSCGQCYYCVEKVQPLAVRSAAPMALAIAATSCLICSEATQNFITSYPARIFSKSPMICRPKPSLAPVAP